MKVRGYDEQTLSHPSNCWEAYGQDGYGWYSYTSDVTDIVGRTRGVTLRPSGNPLFTYMDGMTRRQLVAKGFMS